MPMSLHLKKLNALKKNKFSLLKGKNGDVEDFSLPQTQLDMMQPNVCLVSVKLDFVNVSADFSYGKMWVNNSLGFGPKNGP